MVLGLDVVKEIINSVNEIKDMLGVEKVGLLLMEITPTYQAFSKHGKNRFKEVMHRIQA